MQVVGDFSANAELITLPCNKETCGLQTTSKNRNSKLGHNFEYNWNVLLTFVLWYRLGGWTNRQTCVQWRGIKLTYTQKYCCAKEKLIVFKFGIHCKICVRGHPFSNYAKNRRFLPPPYITTSIMKRLAPPPSNELLKTLTPPPQKKEAFKN